MQKVSKVARKFAAEKAAREKVSPVIQTMIGAGAASPAPPLGPLLGQKGINVASFCKEFNARTAEVVEGVPLPTVITVNPDRTYQLEVQTPHIPWLVQRCAGIRLGSHDSRNEVAGKIQLRHVYEIAKWHPPRLPRLPQRGRRQDPAATRLRDRQVASASAPTTPATRSPARSSCDTSTKSPSGIRLGSHDSRNEVAGKIQLRHVYEIAKVKLTDPYYWRYSEKEMCELVMEQASCCGVEVVEELDPAEYRQFLLERKKAVRRRMVELEEAKAAGILKVDKPS